MAPHAYYRYNLPLLLRNAGRLNLWRICMVSGGGAETSTELLRHLLPNRNICDRHSKCASNPVTTISTPNF